MLIVTIGDLGGRCWSGGGGWEEEEEDLQEVHVQRSRSWPAVGYDQVAYLVYFIKVSTSLSFTVILHEQT